jgi:hypothetical protein
MIKKCTVTFFMLFLGQQSYSMDTLANVKMFISKESAKKEFLALSDLKKNLTQYEVEERFKKIEIFLKQGMPVDIQDEKGQTALFLAVGQHGEILVLNMARM